MNLLVALACAAVLTGCGGGDSDRDRVADYIESVNTVQEQAGPLLQDANEVYRRFADGELEGARAEVEIRRSRLAVDAIRGRVEAVPAPPEARKLRTLIAAVYDANDDMAEQTRLMAVYVPAQEKALRRFRTLGRRLQRDLRRARSDAGAQARALRRYSEGLEGVTEQLQTLRPPLVVVPTRNTQLERLADSRRVALGLRSAVLDKDQARVLELLDEFQDVNARTPSTDATKAAHDAYREYVTAIQTAESRAAAEVRRLNGAVSD